MIKKTLCVCLYALLLAAPASLLAGTSGPNQWDAGGADQNWSTGGNWGDGGADGSGGVVPTSGNNLNLLFPTRLVPSDAITTFDAGLVDPYVLTNIRLYQQSPFDDNDLIVRIISGPGAGALQSSEFRLDRSGSTGTSLVLSLVVEPLITTPGTMVMRLGSFNSEIRIRDEGINMPGQTLAVSEDGTLFLDNASNYIYGGITVRDRARILGTTDSIVSNVTRIANNSGNTFDPQVIFDQSTAGTYAGVLSDIGPANQQHLDLTVQGGGTVTFTGANMTHGVTTISESSTVQFGAANAFNGDQGYNIGTGSSLDMGGFDITIGELNGSGNIINSSAGTTRTLTIQPTANTGGTFTGDILDSTGGQTNVVINLLNPNTPLNISSASALSYTGTTNLIQGDLRLFRVGSPQPQIGSAGQSFTVQSNGTIGGSGTVNGDLIINGGTIAPFFPDPVSTFNVNGSFTMSSGTYRLDLEKGATQPNDTVAVNGSVNITGGGLSISSFGAPLARGDTFDILTSTGTITGTFTNPGTIACFGSNLSIEPDGGGQKMVLALSFIPLAPLFSEGPVSEIAAYWDSLESSASGDLLDVLNALHNITPLPKLAQQLLGTSPSPFGDLACMSHDKIVSLTSSTDEHLKLLRRTGVRPEWGDSFWMVPSFGFTRQSSDALHLGFESEQACMAFGVDTRRGENVNMGMHGMVGVANVDWEGKLAEASYFAMMLGLYGSFTADHLYWNWALTGAFFAYDTQRTMKFFGIDRKADGDHSALAGNLHTQFGYEHMLGALLLNYYALADLGCIGEGGYQEVGADSVNMIVDSLTTYCLKTKLGISGEWKYSDFWSLVGGLAWVWKQPFGDSSINYNYVNQAQTSVKRKSKDTHHIAPRIALQRVSDTGGTMSLYYQAEVGHHQNKQEFGINFGKRF